jgi:hypothetical protein
MSKRTLMVLASMALVAGTVTTLVTCHGSKRLNVKIKVGVVLKSGDVKNVARQDFIISKADIIDLWESSKKNTGYESKLNSLRESINEKNTLINQLRVDFQHQRETAANRFNEHLAKTSRESVPYFLVSDFGYLSDPRIKADDQGFRLLEKTYNELIKANPNPGTRQFLETKYAEFREIKNSFVSPPAAAELSKAQHELDNLVIQQKAFIDFNEDAPEIDRSYFEKAKNDFLLKCKEAFVSVFKTDLNGEANIRIPKGKYYIFCSSEIGLNHITWNYAANILKEGEYIELANDNAFSFDEEKTAQLLRVLYETLAKIEGNQPTTKSPNPA